MLSCIDSKMIAPLRETLRSHLHSCECQEKRRLRLAAASRNSRTLSGRCERLELSGRLWIIFRNPLQTRWLCACCIMSLQVANDDGLNKCVQQSLLKRTMQYVRGREFGGPATGGFGIRASTAASPRQGKLSRSGRGIYTLPERRSRNATPTRSGKTGAGKPSCVCFGPGLSEFTTQCPASVWIALAKGQESLHSCRFIRWVRLTEPSLSEVSKCIRLRAYLCAFTQLPKTVAIASSPQQDRPGRCNRGAERQPPQKKATINGIYRYAKICRVSHVIRSLHGGAMTANRRRIPRLPSGALLAVAQSRGQDYQRVLGRYPLCTRRLNQLPPLDSEPSLEPNRMSATASS